MSQPLPYDGIEMWHGHPDLYMKKLEEISKTPGDNEIGSFIEVDLKYPDEIGEKTKNFPFCLENQIKNKDKYNDFMKKILPKSYTKFKKVM